MTARRRWSFKLRTLFVIVALLSVPLGWLAYQFHWIRERAKGREWLEEHSAGGNFGLVKEPRPELAWQLAILSEQPLHRYDAIRANAEERTALDRYHARVAEIEVLFPESQIIDFDGRRPAAGSGFF